MPRTRLLASSMVAGLMLCLSACNATSAKTTEPDVTATPGSPALSAGATAGPAASATASEQTPAFTGDEKKGRELVEKYQCHRCHDGTDLDPAQNHCFSCHLDIMAGKYDNKPDAPRWKQNVAHLQVVPSLTAIGRRLKPEWIVDLIAKPYDVRPNLVSTMPRLIMTPEEARDIVAYLRSLPVEDTEPPTPVAVAKVADPAAGRQLMEKNSCGRCHVFGGVEPLPKPAAEPTKNEDRLALQLAPDHRNARLRLRADLVIPWVRDPRSIKPDTKMPQIPMTAAEARDMVAYILTTPLEPAKPIAIPQRLPLLQRKVPFEEIRKVVLYKTCRHCHEPPNPDTGDGGPGNTGGLGFIRRELVLTEYRTVAAGALDEKGERYSIFNKTKKGAPRLLAGLLNRQLEEAGAENKDLEVRGMPLGLPSLPPAQIQLIESWIEQGRPK